MPRILMVDHEPGVRRSIRKFLDRAGYETTECGDGTEALALVEQHTFDLILTDGPNLDGPTLARALGTKPMIVSVERALKS